MGRILCKKHGTQGYKEVCEHIHQKYKQDIYHKNRKSGLGNFDFIEVCEDCWRIHNLDEFRHFAELSLEEFLDMDDETAKSIEEDWTKVYNSINHRGLCVQCVAEVIVKQARRNNEPLPFSIFERTLTENQEEFIEKLKKNLLENFYFQKSIRCMAGEYFPAIFFQPGAFTYPFSVKIYYISTAKEQNEIIEFVKNFLRQTELNQAKIEFWEAESWIKSKTKLGFSYHQGEEKLLREVYLNC